MRLYKHARILKMRPANDLVLKIFLGYLPLNNDRFDVVGMEDASKLGFGIFFTLRSKDGQTHRILVFFARDGTQE